MAGYALWVSSTPSLMFSTTMTGGGLMQMNFFFSIQKLFAYFSFFFSCSESNNLQVIIVKWLDVGGRCCS